MFDWINTSNYIPNFDAILFCSVVFLLGCLLIVYMFVAGRMSQYRPRHVDLSAIANMQSNVNWSRDVPANVHVHPVWLQQAPRAWNFAPSPVWSQAVPGVVNVKSSPALLQNVPAAFGKPRQDVCFGNLQTRLTGSFGQADAHPLAP
ncbi:MAG TPA: hypothetical protein VFF88_04735 [Methylocella sp.]|nr:hypothetical protein [Methylocella sp.]